MRYWLLNLAVVGLASGLFAGAQRAAAQNVIVITKVRPGVIANPQSGPANLRGRQFYLVEMNCPPFLSIGGENLKTGDFLGSYYDPVRGQSVPVRGKISGLTTNGTCRITFWPAGRSRGLVSFVGTVVDLGYEADMSGTLRTQQGARFIRASTVCIR
jgi:hypothetical protein